MNTGIRDTERYKIMVCDLVFALQNLCLISDFFFPWHMQLVKGCALSFCVVEFNSFFLFCIVVVTCLPDGITIKRKTEIFEKKIERKKRGNTRIHREKSRKGNATSPFCQKRGNGYCHVTGSESLVRTCTNNG